MPTQNIESHNRTIKHDSNNKTNVLCTLTKENVRQKHGVQIKRRNNKRCDMYKDCMPPNTRSFENMHMYDM